MLLYLLLCCKPSPILTENEAIEPVTDTDTGATDPGTTTADTDTGATDTDTGGSTGTTTAPDTTTTPTDTDTTTDTTTTDTGPACAGITKLDPADLTMQPDGGAYYVTVEGCADPLISACPPWVKMVAPAAVNGSDVVEITPNHGTATPTDGICNIGGMVVNLHLR